MEYTLMHKNVEVAELLLDDESCYILKVDKLNAPEHLPVGIRYSKGIVERNELNLWWQSRSIPASRSGLRDALEILDISAPSALLTKCFGLSLSDQYWVRPKDSGIRWSEINFFDNTFSEDVGTALFGQTPDSKEISLISPDNTSDGCLKKKWIIRSGERCLMKGGSAPFHQEPINEVLASEIMKRLDIPHVDYFIEWENNVPYSICKDFITADTELVSADYIKNVIKKSNDMSNYEHLLKCCETLGIPNATKSIENMLLVDFIIANTDRHYRNFGAVRNAETLEWIGFSPIFDCGSSMWYNKIAAMINPESDAESKPFRSSHSQQIKLVMPNDADLSVLSDIPDFFRVLTTNSPFIDEERKNTLCKVLENRISMASQLIPEPNSDFNISM